MKLFISILATLAPLAALAGGVTGGGGNTHPAQPVTAAEVKESIRGARLYVAAYLNHLELEKNEAALWQAQPLVPGKLFGPSPTLDRVLNLPIRIVEDGPCLDPAGTAMDGSATLSPPEVCLSVPRIQEKLSREALRSQVIALALHEYSHLSGTTEPEAEFLQSMALDNFLRADFIGLDRVFGRAWDFAVYLQMFGGGGEAAPPETPAVWVDLQNSLQSFLEDFQRNLWSAPSVFFLSLTSERLRETFTQTYARLSLMEKGSCERAQTKNSAGCRAYIDKIFRGDSEIDFHTYSVRTGSAPGTFPEHPNVVFRRLRSIPDVQKELERLKADADGYIDYFRGMRGY
jgi:hypothetical protein